MKAAQQACLLIHVYPEETTFEKVFIHLKEPNEKFTMQRQQNLSKKIKILPPESLGR